MKIGKALLDELKYLAKAKKIMQLEVTSGTAREAAHRFYKREGFEWTSKKFIFKSW